MEIGLFLHITIHVVVVLVSLAHAYAWHSAMMCEKNEQLLNALKKALEESRG
jgi:type III secretory pathway component EscS